MLNRIVLMGRLTRDPELRSTQAGISVASFTLAVERDFSGDGGSERQIDFINVVAWRNTADFVRKYFTKGRMAIVIGRLQSRKWVDKESRDRINWEVVAENVYFGDSKRDSGASSAPQQQNPCSEAPPFDEISGDDGDLPF